MSLPLEGQVILTTRAKDQTESTTALLESLGAEVIEAPAVSIEPVRDTRRLDEALANLSRYDWLIVTSVNGVNALADHLARLRIELSTLRTIRLAAIGPATAERLRELGLEPAVVPEQFVAESLAEALGDRNVSGRRCLLLRSDIARAALREALTALGAMCDDIPIYRTSIPAALPAHALARLREGGVDWVTFTSSSTFRNFAALLGDEAGAVLRSVKLASIGPITSNTIREAGYEPSVEAAEFTIDGLVAAISRYLI